MEVDAPSPPANGHSKPGASAAMAHSTLDRSELVRVIAQAVRSLGFAASATKLEQEAGVEAMSEDMRLLRQVVLDGDWDRLEGVLSGIDVFATDSDARAARFVLYEQKFLELLEAGRTSDALECLRTQLTACAPNPKKLHRLPLLHMCTSPDELRDRANWSGTGEESRLDVLERLRAFIPTTHLLAENRLETLLGQALELQKRRAKFPYTKQTSVGLLEDLEHEPERMPRKVLHRLMGHQDEVWFVRFSHDGMKLASASKDKTVIIWDIARVYAGDGNADAIRWRLEGHADCVGFLAWSPDDSKLLSCGNDAAILMWDMSTGDRVGHFKKHTKQVMACVWAPGGRSFYSGGGDKKVYEWDVASGETIASYPVTRECMDLELSKDGKRLVCCSSDTSIMVFDTQTQTLLGTMKEALYITSCSLADDGFSLLVNLTSNSSDKPTNVTDSEIHIWDVNKCELVKKLSGFKQCRFVIRSVFGGYNQMFVLCGSEDKKVYVWERQSGELLLRLDGHTATVNSVHWCPTDAQLFASGSDDNSVIVSTACAPILFVVRLLTISFALLAVVGCGPRVERACPSSTGALGPLVI